MDPVYPEFADEIKAMNQAWGLQVNVSPKDLGVQRFHDFRYTFFKELSELDAIPQEMESIEAKIARADWLCDLYIYLASEALKWGQPFKVPQGTPASGFTKAEWRDLNDFQVICLGLFDEETKILFDKDTKLFALKDVSKLMPIIGMIHDLAGAAALPFSNCLKAVMESNRTKLGADGKPIYDQYGKVEKGPNYQPPEPMLKAIIEASEA